MWVLRKLLFPLLYILQILFKARRTKQNLDFLLIPYSYHSKLVLHLFKKTNKIIKYFFIETDPKKQN